METEVEQTQAPFEIAEDASTLVSSQRLV